MGEGAILDVACREFLAEGQVIGIGLHGRVGGLGLSRGLKHDPLEETVPVRRGLKAQKAQQPCGLGLRIGHKRVMTEEGDPVRVTFPNRIQPPVDARPIGEGIARAVTHGPVEEERAPVIELVPVLAGRHIDGIPDDVDIFQLRNLPQSTLDDDVRIGLFPAPAVPRRW